MDLEFLVVDDSLDGSGAGLAREFPELRITRGPVDDSYAAQSNHGGRFLLTLGCDYVVFLSPDVVMAPSSLSALIEALESDPLGGCVWGVALQQLRERRNLLRRALTFVFGGNPNSTLPCLAFRADAFRILGGFEDPAQLDGPEIALAARLRRWDFKPLECLEATYSYARPDQGSF
jgi:GT2 family glycosyltransferase